MIYVKQLAICCRSVCLRNRVIWWDNEHYIIYIIYHSFIKTTDAKWLPSLGCVVHNQTRQNLPSINGAKSEVIINLWMVFENECAYLISPTLHNYYNFYLIYVNVVYKQNCVEKQIKAWIDHWNKLLDLFCSPLREKCSSVFSSSSLNTNL